jgi:hypothetical protein
MCVFIINIYFFICEIFLYATFLTENMELVRFEIPLTVTLKFAFCDVMTFSLVDFYQGAWSIHPSVRPSMSLQPWPPFQFLDL